MWCHKLAAIYGTYPDPSINNMIPLTILLSDVVVTFLLIIFYFIVFLLIAMPLKNYFWENILNLNIRM